VIPRFPAYLFDIDGTLVDSALDICGAVSEVLSGTERPDVPFELLRCYIGRHLQDLFHDLFPESSQERIDELIREYRAIYPARGHNATSLYPGVAEGLAALGGRKSTATTKGTPTTRVVLEKFGILRHFHHVQGTDGFPSKPAPDVILTAMQALGSATADTLMVGDAPADMEAGRRAGVKICAVTYGYGKPDELARWQPDFWISDLRELSEA
jgi:HAD superfamily hydrolase (TIGR01549 family)